MLSLNIFRNREMIGFFKLEPWKNKTALITGVNSVLGVAIVEKLIKLNMLVIGVDNDSDHLKVIFVAKNKMIFRNFTLFIFWASGFTKM